MNWLWTNCVGLLAGSFLSRYTEYHSTSHTPLQLLSHLSRNITQTTSISQAIQTVYTSRRSGLWLEVVTILVTKIQALWNVVVNWPGVIVPTGTLRLSWLRFFPCFFLSCKANARVKPAKTGHGPHSSTLVVICVVLVNCVVLLLFVLFCC